MKTKQIIICIILLTNLYLVETIFSQNMESIGNYKPAFLYRDSDIEMKTNNTEFKILLSNNILSDSEKSFDFLIDDIDSSNNNFDILNSNRNIFISEKPLIMDNNHDENEQGVLIKDEFYTSSRSKTRDRNWLRPFLTIFITEGLVFAYYHRNTTENQVPSDIDNVPKFTKTTPIYPDGDPWETNWAYHPLDGSEWYLSARNANFTWYESFLFSTFASFFWEYAVETWYEPPSAADLAITSTIGSVFGEFRYFASTKIRRIKNKNFFHYALWCLVDPISVCIEALD